MLPAHSSLIADVRWAPASGEALVTAGFDGKCRVWRHRDWALLTDLKAHDGKCMACDFGPNLDDGVRPATTDVRSGPGATTGRSFTDGCGGVHYRERPGDRDDVGAEDRRGARVLRPQRAPPSCARPGGPLPVGAPDASRTPLVVDEDEAPEGVLGARRPCARTGRARRPAADQTRAACTWPSSARLFGLAELVRRRHAGPRPSSSSSTCFSFF